MHGARIGSKMGHLKLVDCQIPSFWRTHETNSLNNSHQQQTQNLTTREKNTALQLIGTSTSVSARFFDVFCVDFWPLRKTCGFALPEETKYTEFQPPPRPERPKAPPAPTGKVAAAFQLLGLEVTAKQEEVRRAYRRLEAWTCFFFLFVCLMFFCLRGGVVSYPNRRFPMFLFKTNAGFSTVFPTSRVSW